MQVHPRAQANHRAQNSQSEPKGLGQMVGFSPRNSLAGSFRRVGKIGFWAQVVIGVISISLAIYAFTLGRQGGGLGTRGGLALTEYLTILSLLILAFTTAWSYRYVGLAERIEVPSRRPQISAVKRVVWIGVVCTIIGLILSMLIMLFETAQLFLYFLRAPQAGIPVVQVTGERASWVSAGDILGLAVVILTTFVEVLVLSLGLWLLFRTLMPSTEFPQFDE